MSRLRTRIERLGRRSPHQDLFFRKVTECIQELMDSRRLDKMPTIKRLENYWPILEFLDDPYGNYLYDISHLMAGYKEVPPEEGGPPKSAPGTIARSIWRLS